MSSNERPAALTASAPSTISRAPRLRSRAVSATWLTIPWTWRTKRLNARPTWPSSSRRLSSTRWRRSPSPSAIASHPGAERLERACDRPREEQRDQDRHEEAEAGGEEAHQAGGARGVLGGGDVDGATSAGRG
jgi:hypothetical protein